VHRIALHFGRVRYKRDEIRDNVVPDIVACRLQNKNHVVDVPAPIGRVLFHGYEEIRRAVGLELGLTSGQKADQLVCHLDYVVLVDQGEAELHGTSLQGHVWVFEALDYGRAVALD